MIIYLLCIWQLTVFTCLCHLRPCAYGTGGMHGTLGVCTYYIHSLLHRLGVHTVNHYQLLVVNSCMYHGYGCLHVVGTDGAINEGGKSILLLRYMQSTVLVMDVVNYSVSSFTGIKL